MLGGREVNQAARKKSKEEFFTRFFCSVSGKKSFRLDEQKAGVLKQPPGSWELLTSSWCGWSNRSAFTSVSSQQDLSLRIKRSDDFLMFLLMWCKGIKNESVWRE